MRRRGRETTDGAKEQLARLRERVNRERQARLQAESIAEAATRDLYFSVERLEQLNEELRRANDVRDRIVTATAEQMVLPMASVNQLSSALERRWDEITDRNRRMYVGMINEQSSRASRYVQDLVVISQLGASGLEPTVGKVSVAPLIAAVVERTLTEDQEHELSCPGDVVARADTGHLIRILTSLVENAARHGSPPIEVTAERRGSVVAIRVRDHGHGVAPQSEDRLFEPFTSTETLEPGDDPRAGIGLAIARHLAELQGGEIRYTHVEPGSCFTLTLPSA